jgi:hypothetical protein
MKATRQTAAAFLCVLISLGLGLTPGLETASAQEWSPVYSAKEIRATVVDKETGRALEGVVVVAQWVLFVSGPGDGWHGPRLYVTEAVTDKEGKFYIPGWGPKPNPGYPSTGLTDRDPVLSLFKPRYWPLTLPNADARNDAVRHSRWDGKIIELEKYRGTGTEYEWAWLLYHLQLALGWGETMEWRRLPKMTLAILEELERIPRKLRLEQPPFAVLGGPESLGTTLEEVRRFVEGPGGLKE